MWRKKDKKMSVKKKKIIKEMRWRAWEGERENDQNIKEHLKGKKWTVLARPRAYIDYYFKLGSIKTNW